MEDFPLNGPMPTLGQPPYTDTHGHIDVCTIINPGRSPVMSVSQFHRSQMFARVPLVRNFLLGPLSLVGA